MPSDSGKIVAEKELETRNLLAIQRIDPCAKTIMDKAVHVALYKFLPDVKTWEKTDFAGAMFVYERIDKPFYSLMIVNRQSLTDFILPIDVNIQISRDATNKQIMFVKLTDGTINSFWFHKDDDCLRISFTVEKICAALKKGLVPQAAKKKPTRADESQQILNMLRSSDKPTAASKSTTNESARRLDTGSISDNNSQARVNAPSSENFPEMLQKLLIQERSTAKEQSVVQNERSPSFASTAPLSAGAAAQVPLPPASMMLNADELEKDLLRTAKPKNCQFQEFINSPSAASLNALSTRSIHGSEGDRDITEYDTADMSLGPGTQFQLGTSGLASGQSTPLLSKEQLVAALTFMLQNDEDFVVNIHQAYIDAVNSRLK